MKESVYFRKLLVASAILVMAVPDMACASSFINEEGELVVQVSYADLNLSSEAGLVALYKRLQGASSAAGSLRISKPTFLMPIFSMKVFLRVESS